MELNFIHCVDALDGLKSMKDQSIHCCVTSPPYYGLRDYGVSGQIGLEDTPESYIERLVKVFSEVKRVLRDDGTLWVNIGDSYSGSGKGGANSPSTLNGSKQSTNVGSTINPLPVMCPTGCKPKDMIGIPWMLAFALRADGWYLRQDIIWAKPNPMPESVKDRCTKSHEYIFLFSKRPKYYFDAEAIAEPVANSTTVRLAQNIESQSGSNRVPGKTNGAMRNKRDVWTVTNKPFKGAHFATFPPDLIQPCILAGCPDGGIVLDPFAGSGTVGMVSEMNGRKHIGFDINQEYCEMANRRIEGCRK